MSELSIAEALTARSPGELEAVLASLTEHEADELLHDWSFWGRPKQQPPAGDWSFWLAMAGRGWGKTDTGSHWSAHKARTMPRSRGALIARTGADARDVMIEGPAGILAASPRGFYPHYEPSKRRLTWPNGAMATIYSADEPELLRGPQHHWGWCDELAAWSFIEEAWSNFLLGLRLGSCPQACITTTPKPLAILRGLIQDPACVVTRGATRENERNLAPVFLSSIVGKYQGTRRGRQELEGELLDEVEGALVTRAMIDQARTTEAPERLRIVVAIDPAVTSGEEADETGIAVAARGPDGHGYVLADLACHETPHGWATRAVSAYHARKADRMIAERNNGGEMVEATIRQVDRTVSLRTVSATRGKHVRFEPIAALYEQGRIHHVGHFPTLEDQLCSFTSEGYAGDRSPDRADALVWALSELFLEKRGVTPSDQYGRAA